MFCEQDFSKKSKRRFNYNILLAVRMRKIANIKDLIINHMMIKSFFSDTYALIFHLMRSNS